LIWINERGIAVAPAIIGGIVTASRAVDDDPLEKHVLKDNAPVRAQDSRLTWIKSALRYRRYELQGSPSAG
jgi:hypothetical protein